MAGQKSWAEQPINIEHLMSLVTSHRRRHRTFLIAGAILALITLLSTYAHLNGMPAYLATGMGEQRKVASEGIHPPSYAATEREKSVAPLVPNSSIPRKIWQCFLSLRPGSNIDPNNFKLTKSWLAKNPDYTYTLVGGNRGDDFVAEHWGVESPIRQTYSALKNHGLKSDLLRYLLLWKEGGAYSDIDTIALRGVDDWVPYEYRSQTRVIVGIEFDKLDGPNWMDIPHDLQFCQWTIAAAPGHHLFERMAQRAVTSLLELAVHYNTTLPELKLDSFEVMNSTGPAAWTDAVFEELQTMDPTLTNVRNLTAMKTPRLIGDILVLPIDGFGMGQLHSNSSRPAENEPRPAQALVEHKFHGSWRNAEGSRHDEKKEE
jgi:alpha 1,6-mannosyltransferase